MKSSTGLLLSRSAALKMLAISDSLIEPKPGRLNDTAAAPVHAHSSIQELRVVIRTSVEIVMISLCDCQAGWAWTTRAAARIPPPA